MLRKSIARRSWAWSALGLALCGPSVRAQQAAPQEAATEGVLPTAAGFLEGFSVYKRPGDVLEKPITLRREGGDDFLLALAEAGDINIICAGPEPLGDVDTIPRRKLLMPLLELARDGNLSWWRASERTFVMWPRPDEEKLGQAWTSWFSRQSALDAAGEAVSDEEAAAALQQLQVEDTPQARQQLRQDYKSFVRARLQGQVRAGFRKYLEEHPTAPGAAPERVGPFRGAAKKVLDLPPSLREGVAALARVSLRDRWDSSNDLWYSPQRAEFWKQARLRVIVGSDAGKTRWLQLKGPDPSGRQAEAAFTVAHYNLRAVAPVAAGRFTGKLEPRPDKGLRIQGAQMPLRKVLDEVQKQSGLEIAMPLDRLAQARLTLDVRGMEAPEFLAALARAFLIEWKVEGKRVTAQERGEGESDRFLLQLGSLSLYRFLDSGGADDWRQESELSRAVYDEVGDAILSPEGIPISQFSTEVQDGARGEAQEHLLNSMLFGLGSVLPLSVEQAMLVVSGPSARPILVAGGQGAAAPGQREGAMRLVVGEHQFQELAPAARAEPDGAAGTAASPANALEGQAKRDAIVQAFQKARQTEQQMLRARQAHFEQMAARR